MKDENFSFIKGSEASKKLSPEWMEAFDSIMPEWLKVLVPAYNTCKERGVSFFEVANVIDTWSHPERFKEDGFSYQLWNRPGECPRMAFDGTASGWGAWDWKDLMRCRYHRLYDGYNPDYIRIGVELSDWEAYYCYFSRYMNCREPYNFVADRVNEYFKELTGDPDVCFSLDGTSYFALDDAGRRYGGHFSQYYWG